MTSITKLVWRLIDEDPSIRRDLTRGIINVSGLAAYLRETYGIEGSLDSVISAIRRYRASDDVRELNTGVESALRDAVVSTKTRLTAIRLKNSSNLYKYLGEMMKDPEFYRSEVFRLAKSRNESLIFIDAESLARAKKFFPEGNVERVEEGLAELSVTLTSNGWQSKGVMARVANEIANHDVNIVAIISSEPKISIFVREPDLVEAHESIIGLTRN